MKYINIEMDIELPPIQSEEDDNDDNHILYGLR